MKPLVIIHGWSDDSDSFKELANQIQKYSTRSLTNVWLGDYVTLDDEVRMSDIIKAMEKAWRGANLPTTANSCDVIVHSTGGLVIRDWMATYYPVLEKKPPVNNLVMLAPANFGSPLAHKGRSVIGRAVKGFNAKRRFQTGTHILKALEMASPYSWELALRDRFSANAFSQGGIQCTVIVGNTGYCGISSLANAAGSDGTVYVATANLNCAKLMINFPKSKGVNYVKPKVSKVVKSKGGTAFLVMDNYNHSSIAAKEKTQSNLYIQKIIHAIELPKKQFSQWQKECEQDTLKVLKKYENKDSYKHGYQNMIFHVIDDLGNEVEDYVIEFYEDCNNWNDKIALKFNRDAVKTVHSYSDNESYRSFLIDCTRLQGLVNDIDESLKISISAMPDVNDDKHVVGYSTFGSNDIGQVELAPHELGEYFSPNRTLMIEIMLPREQKAEVFELKDVGLPAA